MDNKEGIDHVPIRHLTMVAPIAAGLVLTEGHVKVSWDLQNSFKDWSQFCSVHEEITSIMLHTPLHKGMYNLSEDISNEPNK